MEINIRTGSLLSITQPLLVLSVFQGEALPDTVAALLEGDDWRGEARQTLLLYPRDTFRSRRLLLLGLGARAALTTDTLRQAGSVAAQRARDLRLPGFALVWPDGVDLSVEQGAQALIEGVALGLYRYLQHKSSLSAEQQHQLEQVTLVVASNADIDAASRAALRGLMVADGVKRARDLANMPANLLTPTVLADVAAEIGDETGIQVTVLGREELQQQGFGGLLAVAQGSAQSPCFIIMEYGQMFAADQPTICLVGKGVTFDSGGLSIKPASGMEHMKMDMGGAAAVLGTMQAVAELRLPLHVVALIGAVENMTGPDAFRPGDVITTLSGKTLEILNTDAEGRVVLADALFYAQRYQPQAMIDVATLTGAIDVALGPHATGLMSNDQALAARLLRAGEETAERVWQLPLWDEDREMVKSEVADLRNTGGGRRGGAITAAALLDAFVGDVAWAHLDIAGTMRTEGKGKAYVPAGATGVGVRLLTHTLAHWFAYHPGA